MYRATIRWQDSLAVHASFLTDISQGSVTKRLRCGGNFNHRFAAIWCWVCKWKTFENRSIFYEVMAKTELYFCRFAPRENKQKTVLLPIYTADATQLSSNHYTPPTVELSRVGVCIEFATSSRRICSKNGKLNMLRIFIQSSWLQNYKLGHDCRRVSTHRPTQLDSTRLKMFIYQFFYQILRQSSWANCEFSTHRTTPTRLNSIVESRRRRRCILGFRLLVYSTEMTVQCESKNPPPRNFLTFFPKRSGNFSPNFTRLLYVPICAGLQFFLFNYL